MESTGQEWTELTLWPEDTPASHSAPQDAATAKTILDTSGRCSLSAFAWYDPDSHCWRTSQGTLVSDLDLFSQTWPRSGMTQDGTAYQLPPSAPRTSAIAYSLSLNAVMEWTPTAKANQMCPSMIPRNPGVVGPNSDGLWPTATTQDHATRYAQGGMPLGMAARIWPTPTANGWGSTGHQQMLDSQVQQGQITKDEKRQMVQGHGGKLNPTWVEWLMGFPIGWTDLED